MNDHDRIQLREHVEALLTLHREVIDSRFAAMDLALTVAKEENNRRLEELNSLRREYTQDRGGFITRREMQAWMDQIAERDRQRDKDLSYIKGRAAAYTVSMGLAVSLLGVLLTLLT